MNNEELYRKALDLACEVILSTKSYNCDTCFFNDGLRCTKKVRMKSDGMYDCDDPKWWKEVLLKEIRDGNSKT